MVGFHENTTLQEFSDIIQNFVELSSFSTPLFEETI